MKRELERRTRPFGRRGLDTTPLALLILDLDDFKGVNDRHGHQVGDAVLQEATARVLSMLRSTDTLARIGGDEFAIVAPGAHGDGAAGLAVSVRMRSADERMLRSKRSDTYREASAAL
ncbi:MAG: GGDEF domain-containing protein [Actinobacteria bacterium]|nr:GGDEF domain-containing protein [Actinomycetota bacterium]